jgi:hypothetical protein
MSTGEKSRGIRDVQTIAAWDSIIQYRADRRRIYFNLDCLY